MAIRAMIGQSVINVTSGGRGRLSRLTAARCGLCWSTRTLPSIAGSSTGRSAAGLDADCRHRVGHAEEIIASRVREDSVDLLVMGAYGHSRIRQFIIGSSTTTMLRTCLVPVLLLR